MEITKRNWSLQQIMKFREFHNLVKKRLALEESEESAYRDKPEGYSDSVKVEFQEHGGIKLPKLENMPKTVCWNCGKSYTVR